MQTSLENRVVTKLNGVPVMTAETVTHQGVLTKLGMATLVAAATAVAGWSFFNIVAYIVAVLAALGLSFWTSRDPVRANQTLLPYAAVEGYIVAGFSQLILQGYQADFGLVILAMLYTGCIFVTCLVLYGTGVIQYSDKFRNIVMALCGAAAVFYLVLIATSLFGNSSLSSFYAGSSWLSIGLSLLMVGVATSTLVLDFMFLRKTEGRVPSNYEAYLAFAMLGSLVYIYLEMLRLVAKLSRRN